MSMKRRQRFSSAMMKRRWMWVILLGFLLIGCAGKKPVTVQEPMFWPPPPNAPRVQYLTSIDDSRQITKVEKRLSLFGYGEEGGELAFPLIKPYGMDVHGGKIYLCEMATGNVFIIDFAGKTFEPLPGNRDIGKMMKPINLAVADDGRIFVADIGRGEVVIYSPDGQFVKAIGKRQGIKPSDVAIDDRFLYVLDVKAHGVRLYDLKTYAYREIIGQERVGDSFLAIPTNMTLSAKKRLHVTNVGNGQVVTLDRDGHILQSFGKLGDGFGQFGRPKGVATDEEERIYVVDAAHQNVQVFDPTGDLLMFFGGVQDKDSKGGMKLPAGIMVTGEMLDYFKQYAAPGFTVERLVLVTNHFGPHRLAIYGMGSMAGADYTIPEPPPGEAKEGK